MRPLVVAEFGFTDEKTPEATSCNVALVKSLLENRKNFTYKDRKEAKGAFEANIIQKGMIKWCYEKKNSLGVKFPAYFMDASTGGVSFGIIVAILTAVEACVMEWSTGTRTETKFYKEQYAAVFNTYLTLLVNFHEDGTEMSPTNLSQVAPLNTSVDEFAAAAAEWDDRSGADSEDDW
ncbi:hypothetical protein BDR06DRAFT_1015307 [Suillus hirtellus]|nr:hypothetical protein BDR06DRAFT_1015307 [Suillus hirtellus]